MEETVWCACAKQVLSLVAQSIILMLTILQPQGNKTLSVDSHGLHILKKIKAQNHTNFEITLSVVTFYLESEEFSCEIVLGHFQPKLCFINIQLR